MFVLRFYIVIRFCFVYSCHLAERRLTNVAWTFPQPDKVFYSK